MTEDIALQSRSSDPVSLSKPRSRPASFATIIALGALLVSGAVFKIFYFHSGRLGLDSDQAIAGIGALRLLQGGRHYVFLPGQNYNGEFYTYYLLLPHALFEPSVALVRLSMLPLCLAVAAAAFFAVRAVYRSDVWALSASALLVFSPGMPTDWLMRASSLYIVVLIGYAISLRLLYRMVRTIRRWGWNRANQARGFAVGAILGFCYWCHFSTAIAAVSLAAALVFYPREMMALAGFRQKKNLPKPRWTLRTARVSLQVLSLVVSLALTRLFLYGPWDRQSEAARASLAAPTILLAGLAAVCGSILFLAQRPPRASAREQLGPVVTFFGLWVGAAPVVWHLWGEAGATMEFGRQAADFGVFKEQFASVFHTGIPVLLGYFHNWRWEVESVPVIVRVAALALNAAAMALTAVWLVFSCFRRSSRGRATAFIVVFFVAQVLLFASSSAGGFVAEPRYLLALYWLFCAAVGAMIHLLWRSRMRVVRGLAPLILLFLVGANIASSLACRRMETVGWTGIERQDGELLDYLETSGIRRVSCRFDAQGYWSAYKLTYLADERVIFAPALHPLGMWNRSPRYQREVDNADEPAYLLREPAPSMRPFLEAKGVSFEERVFGPYRLYYDLGPDVLENMSQQEYFEAAKTVR